MTSFVVVDTDVFSFLWQKKNSHHLYAQHLVGKVPVLSFTSVAEAYFGATKARWGQGKMQNLEEAIRRYVIAPYDDQLAKLWGKLKADAQDAGHALGAAAQTNDLWIGATAIFHDAPLLTNNIKHFAGFPGLTLIAM
jgi:tRNA(fMet)-specific endonuclease VapC